MLGKFLIAASLLGVASLPVAAQPYSRPDNPADQIARGIQGLINPRSQRDEDIRRREHWQEHRYREEEAQQRAYQAGRMDQHRRDAYRGPSSGYYTLAPEYSNGYGNYSNGR